MRVRKVESVAVGRVIEIGEYQPGAIGRLRKNRDEQPVSFFRGMTRALGKCVLTSPIQNAKVRRLAHYPIDIRRKRDVTGSRRRERANQEPKQEPKQEQ